LIRARAEATISADDIFNLGIHWSFKESIV
jgi:hypothetical protein